MLSKASLSVTSYTQEYVYDHQIMKRSFVTQRILLCCSLSHIGLTVFHDSSSKTACSFMLKFCMTVAFRGACSLENLNALLSVLSQIWSTHLLQQCQKIM